MSLTITKLRSLLRSPLYGYIFLGIVATLILYWRFPNNVTHPNFYGEDGSVFLQNVINHGWISGAIHTFNGYFVVGLYAIEGLGWVLNLLFGHEGLLSLPQYFALAAILFMGFSIALPYLLFKNRYGWLKMLLVVVFGMLLPLPTSPHIVIGTVGNQKWIFLYIAFLVTLYWLQNYKRLTWARLCMLTICLLICGYTNTTTYFLVPVLFMPYLTSLFRAFRTWHLLARLKELSQDKIFLFLVGMVIILLPQIIYVYLHGIPKIPGYLDTPYQANRTVELFINRTYLFGVTHLFNKFLNDTLAVIIFVVMIGTGFWALKKEEYKTLFLSLYAAGAASLLFTLNRTGVTAFLNGYDRSGSGPDQFFYAQTLVMYLVIVLIAFAACSKLKKYHLGNVLLTLFIIVVIGSGLISNVVFGTVWRNASVYENDAGIFTDQALISCAQQHGSTVRVTVYPYATGQFSLTTPRDSICNSSLSKYQSSVQSLGLIANGNFITPTRGTRVYQTFRASEPRLNGIRIFISDFGNNRRNGSYVLHLYEGGCKHELRETSLPSITMDNWWYNARFSAIDTSANQTYCFSVSPPRVGSYSPLALQVSTPNIYSGGYLKVNGAPQEKDIVFAPLFSRVN